MIDAVFQERMVKFLGVLARRRSAQDRTIVAILDEASLDTNTFGKLAMYALAKQWIRIEPVGNAKIHSITALGRRILQRLKSGEDINQV